MDRRCFFFVPQVGAVPPSLCPMCVCVCVSVTAFFFYANFFLLIFYAPRACPASVCASLLLFFALIVFLLVLLLLLLLFLVCVFFFVSCFLTVSRGVSFGWWPRFSQDMKRCTAPGVDHGRAGLGLGRGLVRGLVRGSRCHM